MEHYTACIDTLILMLLIVWMALDRLNIYWPQSRSIRARLQSAGIQAARDRNGGKCPWGGSKAGRRLKVTEEKEDLIRKLKADGKNVKDIARLVGLTRQTCHKILTKLTK